MIFLEQKPFTDPDKQLLSDFVNHPGRRLYQQFLMSQAAECEAKASNLMVGGENPNAGADEADAKEEFQKAKVFVAAKKMLDDVSAKDYKFYTVEIKPAQ